MVFGFSLDPLGAVLVFGGGMAIILLVRYIAAYLSADVEPGESQARVALDTTTRWAAGVLAAFASAVGVGIVEFTDVVGMVTMFLGQHPFAASNIGIAGLGAAVISGLVSLSPGQYLGLSFVVIGAVMVAMEADD